MREKHQIITAKHVSLEKAVEQTQAFYKETSMPSVLLYENVVLFLGIPKSLILQSLVLFKEAGPSAALEIIQEEVGLGLVAFGSDIVNFQEFESLVNDYYCYGLWIRGNGTLPRNEKLCLNSGRITKSHCERISRNF